MKAGVEEEVVVVVEEAKDFWGGFGELGSVRRGWEKIWWSVEMAVSKCVLL